MSMTAQLLAPFQRRARVGDAGSLTKPTEWLSSFFGGGPTKSGVRISEFNADTLSTVWACIRAISEDVAKLPLNVYRREGATDVVDHAHTLDWILDRKPNPWMTSLVFRETMTSHCVSWGNAFAEIERDNAGRTIALWPIRPDRVQIQVDEKLGPIYMCRTSTGRQYNVPFVDMLHLKGLGFDGLIGYSVIAKARESIGMGLAAEYFGSSFFKNGARPSGTLMHPQKLEPAAREMLRKSAEEQWGGDNAARVMVLWEGLQWTQTTIPPEEAQFLETREFQVPEICRWFRMKPHKVAHLLNAHFNNIEHESQGYVTDTLQGWFERWEQECDDKLLLEAEKRKFRTRHNAEALLRGDIKSRFESYAQGRQWGIFSINDCLSRENLPLVSKENGGDDRIVPVNMTTMDVIRAGTNTQIGSQPPATPVKAAAARSLITSQRSIVLEAWRRVLRIEADKAIRAEKRGGLLAWAAEYAEEHRALVSRELAPVAVAMDSAMRAIAGEPAVPWDWGTSIDAEANEHVDESAEIFRRTSDLAGDIGTWRSSRAKRLTERSLGRLALEVHKAWNLTEQHP